MEVVGDTAGRIRPDKSPSLLLALVPFKKMKQLRRIVSGIWSWYEARISDQSEYVPGWMKFLVFMLMAGAPAFVLTCVSLYFGFFKLGIAFGSAFFFCILLANLVFMAWPLLYVLLRFLGLIIPGLTKRSAAWNDWMEWETPYPPKTKAYEKWKKHPQSQPIDEQPLGGLHNYARRSGADD